MNSKSTDLENTGFAAPTQTTRRVKYGLNVSVAVLAALALAILINILSQRYLRVVQPLDLTASGQYSLSPKTRLVLKNLKGEHRIVTLMGASDPSLPPDIVSQRISRTRDLIDQYARYSPNVKVEHINADLQSGRVEAFLLELRQRYEQELKSSETAIDHALQLVQEMRGLSANHATVLHATANDPGLKDGDLKNFLRSATQSMGRLDSELNQAMGEWRKLLSAPLPAYTPIRQALETNLSNLNDKLYGVLIKQFEMAVKLDSTPPSVSEKLLAMSKQFDTLRKQIDMNLSSLRAIPPAEEYEQVRNTLNNNPNPVVLVGPRAVRVLWLAAMFRSDTAAPPSQQPGERREQLFQGEDRLTGALVSMTLEKAPLVVFVSTGRRPAISAGGQFEHVAMRLQNMQFQVRTWNPLGQMGPVGQMVPPGPPPQPEPGQPVVWILLPSEPANPMDFSAGAGEQQAVEFLLQRMDKNESIFVITGYSPTTRLGSASPLAPLLDPIGLKVHSDSIVLRQVTGQDQKARALPVFEFTQWSDQLPITKALAGNPAVFAQVSPLELPASPSTNLLIWPMITLTGRDIWAEKNIDKFPDVQRDPANAKDQYVIAAAIQRDKFRMIVIADPMWATNYVTTNADRMLRPQGEGLAEIFGAAYPGNAELFVNSVQWLAGLDQLIAASARTQDIRRIGPLSTTQMTTIRVFLLAGVPLTILLIGLGVWIARRG